MRSSTSSAIDAANRIAKRSTSRAKNGRRSLTGAPRAGTPDLGGDLDGPFDIADLVDEPDLDRLLREPHLAGRHLDDALAWQAASLGDTVDERLVEAVDQGLLLRAFLVGVLAPG